MREVFSSEVSDPWMMNTDNFCWNVMRYWRRIEVDQYRCFNGLFRCILSWTNSLLQKTRFRILESFFCNMHLKTCIEFYQHRGMLNFTKANDNLWFYRFTCTDTLLASKGVKMWKLTLRHAIYFFEGVLAIFPLLSQQNM